jgi:serine/threonine-protein kinase HipA
MRPCETDLFRRLLFNCAINNTDDHLRNHAFLRDEAGWRISPAFDLVVGRGRRLVLRPAAGMPPTVSIDDALRSAPSFGLTAGAASSIRDEVLASLDAAPEFIERYEISKRDQGTIQELAPLPRR